MRSINHQFTRCAAIAVFTAGGMLTLSPPSATAQSVACAGDIIVSAPAVKLSSPSPSSSSVTLASGQLPAGTYLVTGASSDPAHPVQEDQPNEQWSATISTSDGSSVQTAISPDIPTANQEISFALGEVTLSAAGTAITFVHAGQGSAGNSVFPVCVGFTRKTVETTVATTIATTVATTVATTIETTVPTTPRPTAPAPTAIPVLVPVVTAAPAPLISPTTTSAAPQTTVATTLPSRPVTTVAPIQSVPPTPEVAGESIVKEPLAYTGSPTEDVALFAAGLLIVGSLLVSGTRRNSSRRNS